MSLTSGTNQPLSEQESGFADFTTAPQGEKGANMPKYNFLGSDALQQKSSQQMFFEHDADVRRHYQTFDVGIKIPLGQALFTGALAGALWFWIVMIAAVLLTLFVNWAAQEGGESFRLSLWWSPLVGLLAAIMVALSEAGRTWQQKVKNWEDRVKHQEEVFRGIDLDGDGYVSKPPVMDAYVTRDDGGSRQQTRHQFTGDPGKVIELLEEILANGNEGLGENYWTPRAKAFTPKEYWNNIDVMVKAGALRWKNPEAHAQGVEVTPEGPAIIDQWIESLTPPPVSYVPENGGTSKRERAGSARGGVFNG